MPDASGIATLHIRLLGGPEIRLGDRPIHLETGKTLALLAYLIVRPGPHQRDMLADLLWGEQGPARAARNLRRALWNIRHNLCPEGEDAPCPFLVITRREAAFNLESPHTLDVRLFEAHLQAAQDALKNLPRGAMMPEDVLDHLQACVRLYRGDFLEGVYVEGTPAFESWLLGERAYYREQILQVLTQLSEMHTARGEYNAAILVLRRLLALAPWSEWAHRQLMLCYALTGRRSDALAQFQRCKRILRDELDVAPLPETVDLYERIRSSDQFAQLIRVDLDRPLREDALHLPPIPFLGREQEHAWLLDHWKRRSAGLTLVEGPAGIGKTRLVEEVLRQLGGRGIPILQGRCHQFGTSVPFQPFVDALRSYLRAPPNALSSLEGVWLAELSGLLPELRAQYADLPPPVVIEKEMGARQRLFEAVVQTLRTLATPALVLFLDDLHWADPDTIDLVQYLAHRLVDSSTWVVATYREEDLEAGHPFLLLRRELGRQHRAFILHLQPLHEEAVRALAQSIPGLREQERHALSAYLMAQSVGNPFILVETLHDLVDRQVLQRTGTGWRADVGWLERATRRLSDTVVRVASNPHPIPRAVTDMILARVERLPPPNRSLLEMAAILGEPFTRELLHTLTNVTIRDVEDALALWHARGLVHTPSLEDSSRYDFTHPLLREVLYTHIPPLRRRHLHGHVAETLERLYAGREHSIVETLAYHYAASERREKAIYYLLAAGEAAQARQAQETAIYFFSRALDIIPEDDLENRYRALSGRERAYNQLARREAQARDLDVLADLANALEAPVLQADVLRRRAEWAMRTARFREGIARATEAQRFAQAHNALALSVDALRIESMCLLRLGDFAAAMQRCEEALRICRDIGDRRREVLVLGTLAIAELDHGQIRLAREHMETVLEYWRATDDIWHHAIACNNLSMVYHRLGEYGPALSVQEEARQLIPRTGDLGLNAYSLVSLGILYATLGRYEESLHLYQQAMDLARTISDKSLQAYIHACQGDALCAMEAVEEAQNAYQAALSIEEDLGVYFYRPQIWEGLSRCALLRGEWDEADSCLQKARHYHALGDYPGYFVSLALHAYVQAHRNRQDAARDLVEQFITWTNTHKEREEPDPEAWWLISQTLTALGDKEGARRALTRAHTILQRRAATLENDLRNSYLFHIPAHRSIMEVFSGT